MSDKIPGFRAKTRQGSAFLGLINGDMDKIIDRAWKETFAIITGKRGITHPGAILINRFQRKVGSQRTYKKLKENTVAQKERYNEKFVLSRKGSTRPNPQGKPGASRDAVKNNSRLELRRDNVKIKTRFPEYMQYLVENGRDPYNLNQKEVDAIKKIFETQFTLALLSEGHKIRR